MSGRPSWKSAEIGLFRPVSAFFALFQRVGRAPGKSRKRRKKAFFLRYPQICLNPHLLNPPFAALQIVVVTWQEIIRKTPFHVCNVLVGSAKLPRVNSEMLLYGGVCFLRDMT